MCDMTEDIFLKHAFGRLAKLKMGDVPENFRLFTAGWLEQYDSKVMEVKGAEFRTAIKGPNKGKLCIKIPFTTRRVILTAEEIKQSYVGEENASEV